MELSRKAAQANLESHAHRPPCLAIRKELWTVLAVRVRIVALGPKSNGRQDTRRVLLTGESEARGSSEGLRLAEKAKP